LDKHVEFIFENRER